MLNDQFSFDSRFDFHVRHLAAISPERSSAQLSSTSMSLSFKGHTVVVTGAGGGLGRTWVPGRLAI